MIKTEDFTQKPLFEQLDINAHIADFEIFYKGDDYDRAMSVFEECGKRYGKEGNSAHFCYETMELASEQAGKITCYAGRNFIDDKGDFCALLRKKL